MSKGYENEVVIIEKCTTATMSPRSISSPLVTFFPAAQKDMCLSGGGRVCKLDYEDFSQFAICYSNAMNIYLLLQYM